MQSGRHVHGLSLYLPVLLIHGLRQVEVAVLSPSPMDLPAPGILDLTGSAATGKGIRAGDGTSHLEGITFNQEAAHPLGLDSWELVAVAVGGQVGVPLSTT